MIQDGRIDAAFYTVGHPSGYYKEATAGKRKVKFIPITNIEGLLKKYPYYAKSVTRVLELYPAAANDLNVPTFGVKATFVTSIKVPENVVYAVTKEVFENFDDFKKLHPANLNRTFKLLGGGARAKGCGPAVHSFRQVGLSYLTLY